MITLSSNKETITGSIDGKPYSVPFTKEGYDKLKTYSDKANAADNRNSYNAYATTFKTTIKKLGEVVQEKKVVVVGTTNLSLKLNEIDNKYYLYNGKSTSKFFVPQGLVARIQESESKEIDATPLYKFFARLLRNPVMTQDKAGRIVEYINKTWVDQEIYQEAIEKGLEKTEALKQATVYQVGITQEGLLVTYKASTLIGERQQQQFEEEPFNEDEVDISEATDIIKKANGEEVDTKDFVYQPVRNKKGHFWKRGSDEYLAEYNRQLEAYKQANGGKATEVLTKKVKVNEATKTITKKVEAVTKYAEDYTFEPANMHQSGDAFYCGDVLGHIIQVGKRHYLPYWSQVNTNDSTSMVKGLHVGGLDYIQNYTHGEHNVIHNIFVSPEHIGAVVAVENGDGAMRVKEYFVHSSFIGPNRGLYNSSTYAAETDMEWDAALQHALQVVKEANAKIDRIKEEAAAAQDIVNNAF